MGLLDKLTGDSGLASKLGGGSSSGGNHSGGGLGGFGGGKHSAGSGHVKSEKDEDMLDKGEKSLIHPTPIEEQELNFVSGIDFVQEKVLKKDQSNESAKEQQQDQKIADFIRKQYKGQTGKEFPIKEKHHK